MVNRFVGLLLVTLLVQAGASASVRYAPITGDADSQISSSKTYTHVLDFGSGAAATVNGVSFVAGSANMPGIFSHVVTSGSGFPTTHAGNGNHNVTGNLANLLSDMVYTGSNTPDTVTRATVTGMTVGEYYDLRIYSRRWDTNPSGRDVDLTFSNGLPAESVTVGTINQDDATVDPPGFAAANQAYFISYRYLAKAESVTIDFEQFNNNQSWHVYGLTNEVIAPQQIDTLFSTGVDATGQLLASGSADPHYDLIVSADAGGSAAQEIKAKHAAWLSEAAPDDASGWITPPDGVDAVAAGDYLYQTEFDLAGFDPTTAKVQFKVAADDFLDDVLLNGVSLGITADGHDAWSETFTIDAGFVEGMNTLTFEARNGGTDPNPAGLRVEIVSATALATIPEPGVLAMLGLTTLGMLRRGSAGRR